MIKSITKAAVFFMLCVYTLGAGTVVARSVESTRGFIDKNERADEAVEKLINNVKVFYNPIAEQVTVNFKLGKQANVTIKVMDALGNEVLNLMNGRLDGGIQNLSFESNSKLTTGVYFVRVSSGAETVVKRISVR
ncbi:T9SS type A sorting domain-containing protein [Sphingobacterium psychroaquaticum]|nr:T9SS type A sorting domain-containing protein [Sphingobacterium psychroaquaticum]